MTLLLTEDLQTEDLTQNQDVSVDLGEKTKKRYNLINDETRRQVVEMVEIHNASLKDASKKFGIKLSTCKAILQVFQKEGRFEKKKKRIRKNSNLLCKILSKESNTQDSKDTSCATLADIPRLFSVKISKSTPFKLVPVLRLKRHFLSPKPKCKSLAKSSMEEGSDTRSDHETNCSSRKSFFKFPHQWKIRPKTSWNSTNSSPQQGSDDCGSLMEEEENYSNVLRGMWRDVFEFFGK